jgi:hypothetical protein
MPRVLNVITSTDSGVAGYFGDNMIRVGSRKSNAGDARADVSCEQNGSCSSLGSQTRRTSHNLHETSARIPAT